MCCSFSECARLAAENLFLRRQLALFQEREKKAKPTTAADRFVLCRLACLFDWRDALVIVKPGTLIGWHRSAFRHFWHWKSRPVGRPPLPVKLRFLIRRMAAENPTWGEERIADELRLKLGILVSPRTVGKGVSPPPTLCVELNCELTIKSQRPTSAVSISPLRTGISLHSRRQARFTGEISGTAVGYLRRLTNAFLLAART